MNYWSAQEVLRRLDRAFAAFFGRLARGEKPGYPRFKSARRFDTLCWTMKGNAGGVAITEHGRLRLQGVGCVKVKWHRPLPARGALGEVKVTRSSDRRRWHVAVAKSALNREIADQGWAQMLSFLAYKAEEAGRRVVAIDPLNTSRTCASCGTVDPRSRTAERFRCVACEHTDDADVNAAKVILARALARKGIERPGRGRQAQTEAVASVA